MSLMIKGELVMVLFVLVVMVAERKQCWFCCLVLLVPPLCFHAGTLDFHIGA